ncbi:TPA: hypothetical protein QCQ90_002188 [Bacillus cereus]|nr:hypothetical protein [Bacillus cereus]HDR4620461.1 hypothetical protein [Bacillus cereus]
MKVVYKYDSSFMYIEPVLLEASVTEGAEVYEMPENCTDVQPIDGLYLAKFDIRRQMWIESASQEYIDQLHENPMPPDEIELLKKQNATLILDAVKKDKQIADMRKQQASLILSLTEKGVL